MMNSLPVLYFAIPVMNEAAWLPSCLACIEKQTYHPIKIVVCVNQPENFSTMLEKKEIVENNARTLEYLKTYDKIPLHIIDRSSEGHGWKGKKHGVGWARKVTMDYVSSVAAPGDFILSMDADTVFNPMFCESIVRSFQKHKNAVGIALPYYHRLTGDEVLDPALLRYEIYMRYYAINLWRIKNPYCFTAIGSSMAVPVHAYRAIGGITPKLSGEDFYFLQKLRKYGNIIVRNEEKTYPASRYSDRVFFGTGPALIKGVKHEWESYPMYSYRLFDEVKETFGLFHKLFHEDVPTPMTGFLEENFKTKNLWGPLRDNFITEDRFVKACAEKVDGLRILQFLKSRQSVSDNEMVYLTKYLNLFHPTEFSATNIDAAHLHFEKSGIGDLDSVRNLLEAIENEYRNTNKVIDWY